VLAFLILSVFVIIFVMLSTAMLSVIMLSVVMLSVLAPEKHVIDVGLADVCLPFYLLSTLSSLALTIKPFHPIIHSVP
jgi:hypothetical protein